MLAPVSLVFEDKELTMFSFGQLEQLSNKVVRSRAWQMRDQIGVDRLPAVPHESGAIVMWILDTQTAISRIVGQEYTIYDFGFPKHGLPSSDGGFFDPQPPMGTARRFRSCACESRACESRVYGSRACESRVCESRVCESCGPCRM